MTNLEPEDYLKEDTRYLNRANLNKHNRFQDKLATMQRHELVALHEKTFPKESAYYRELRKNTPRQLIERRLGIVYALKYPPMSIESPHYKSWVAKMWAELEGRKVPDTPALYNTKQTIDIDQLSDYTYDEIAVACISRGFTFPQGTPRYIMEDWLMYGRRPAWTDYISKRAQLTAWVKAHPGGSYAEMLRDWDRGPGSVPSRNQFNVVRSNLKSAGVGIIPLPTGRHAG